MTLIIRDTLIGPPTWFLSFRDLTLFCSTFYRLNPVIESEFDMVDYYHHWLKDRGGMDFVEDFVRPGSEDGIRLDIRPKYPRTIVTDRIVPENVPSLIGRIRIYVPSEPIIPIKEL